MHDSELLTKRGMASCSIPCQTEKHLNEGYASYIRLHIFCLPLTGFMLLGFWKEQRITLLPCELEIPF